MHLTRGTKSILAIAALGLVCMAVPAAAADGPSPTPVSSDATTHQSKDSGFGSTPITDPRQDRLYTAQDRMAPVLDKYRDVLGETRWDMDTQTLTVELTDGPQGNAARSEFSKLDLPVNVAFTVVKYSKSELLAAAVEIIRTAPEWARGLSGLSYAGPDTALGTVVLGVDLKDLAAWRKALPKADAKVPVVVRGEAETGIDFQSRQIDYSPWSGGQTIYGTRSSGSGSLERTCTAGWTWVRWSGLGDAASTAEHCINTRDGSGNYLGTSYTPWRNLGTEGLVGAAVKTSPSADAALLQSSGQGYSATVWVGGIDTTDLRPVQSAAASDSIGEQVALSGAATGLTVGTVVATDYPIVLADGTLRVTILGTAISADGDSGGPMLQTYSGSGNARAKGMLIGLRNYGGSPRTIYTQITRISSFLSASIKISP